jgi:D-alanyl-D-alanine carboxypeptidase
MTFRACALLCCTTLLAGPACGGDRREPEPTPPPGPRLTGELAQQLDTRLRERVADAGIPGASAAIVFADGRMWSGAAGDAVVKPRRAMTTDTSLPFDSITKVATAAVALRLVEEGKLRLDDPIVRWYPTWRGDDDATVRDLLGHTSGARDPLGPIVPDRPLSQERALADAPEPTARTLDPAYSNVGYLILGRILERAAGEPLATAMRRRVFADPGGDGLAFQPAERPREPRAHSYWYPRGGGTPVDANDGGPVLPTRPLAATFGAAGALAGDVPSLARWGRSLFGGEVLEPASLREMTRFRPGGFWEAYGLGLAKESFRERTMWGHTGDGIGSHTELWHLPRERLTLAVTWNDDALEFEGGIHTVLLETVFGLG